MDGVSSARALSDSSANNRSNMCLGPSSGGSNDASSASIAWYWVHWSPRLPRSWPKSWAQAWSEMLIGRIEDSSAGQSMAPSG